MWKRFLTIAVVASASLCTPLLHAQIRVIGEIQHTPLEIAATGVPVRIEAQVTHLHPQLAGLYLFDGERGIYVHLPQAAGLYEGLTVGSNVRVEGVTSSGGFVPDVIAKVVTILGWSDLPEPRGFKYFEIDLANVELDCEWVSIWGRVVDVKVLEDFDYLIAELEINDSRVSLQIPYSEENLAKTRELVFQRVNVPGVLGTVYNRHRQMTGRTFMVNSPDDFTVYTVDREGTDEDVQPIEMLMRAGQDNLKRTHTRGLVTYADENSVCLRGEKSSIKVAALGRTQLRPGDYVEVLGYVWPLPISPAFRARQVTILEQREPPEPKLVDLSDALSSDWCYELIQTEATLIDISETLGLSRFAPQKGNARIEGRHASLLCRSGERIFEARLPSNMLLTDELKPGSKLQLTGICNLVPNLDPRWSHFTESVWLELRLEDGVEVMRPVPWWTVGRLLGAVVIVLGIAGLFLVWVVLLRKTVTRQTKIIGKQIEQASVENERQRIARELHDTLEQSLAGTTFQLESCAKHIESDPERGKESLQLAQSMLRYCREESRSSIVELRSRMLEKMDLPAALNQTLQPLTEECEAKLTVTVTGQPRRLTLPAERHLFRLTKEAVANAVHHASPQHISVALDYRPNALSLSISDDGSGFEIGQLRKSERFGLQGMRERANRIHATIEIESVVGQGTTIRVDLPSTLEWEITQQ